MLTLSVIPGPPLEANCYLLADVAAGEAVILDGPWRMVETLTAALAELGVAPRLLVCTHGHWDHTMGVADLKAAFDIPVACHAADVEMLEHPSYGPFDFPFPLVPVTPDRLLAEGDTLTVGGHALTVLHTPGHTPGSICLYAEADALLFTGDTLFAGTCGRVDFPGGSPAQMRASLQRLTILPPAVQVFPGHGADTTIGAELAWMQNVRL
jgi:hydroxyacylglutathione hydrolase